MRSFKRERQQGPSSANAALSLSETGFATRAAVVLSFVFNPFIVPPLLAWVLMVVEAAPTGETIAVVGVVFLLLSAVPALFLIWRVRTGRVSSFEVSDPNERIRIALVAVGGALALLPALTVVTETTPRSLVAVLLVYMLDVALLMAITRYWRISLHVATLGGFFGVVLFAVQDGPSYALAGLVLTALASTGVIGWARLQLRAHTPAQVVLGALFGLIVPFLQLQGARVLGWL